MVDSKILKHKSSPPKFKKFSTNINSLPQELLVEVIARVASSSTTNLISLKATSKYLSAMSNNGYVLEHVSMDKLPRNMWPPICNNGARTFLKLCKKNGNPEALFRYGVFEYFISTLKVDLGFEKLKKAAEKGHEEANYMYGMILLSSSKLNSIELGMEVLNTLLKKLGPKGITECRLKIKSFLHHFWPVNNVVNPNILDFHNKTCDVAKQGNRGVVNKVIKNGWISNDEEDFITAACNFCMWMHEAEIFYSILNKFHGHRF